jgi:hypothetical protein
MSDDGPHTGVAAMIIGAVFTGQKGFSQANAALDRTQRNAHAASRSIGATFGKIAGAVAGTQNESRLGSGK